MEKNTQQTEELVKITPLVEPFSYVQLNGENEKGFIAFGHVRISELLDLEECEAKIGSWEFHINLIIMLFDRMYRLKEIEKLEKDLDNNKN